MIRVIKAGDIAAFSTQASESTVQEERLESLRKLQKSGASARALEEGDCGAAGLELSI